MNLGPGRGGRQSTGTPLQQNHDGVNVSDVRPFDWHTPISRYRLHWARVCADRVAAQFRAEPTNNK
jgi:hypothetical protein